MISYCQDKSSILSIGLGEGSRFVGLIFTGSVGSDGELHGNSKFTGISELNNNEYIISCFVVNDKCNGWTEYHNLTTGEQYLGYTAQHLKQGNGKLVIPDQYTYVGTWKDDLMDGTGVLVDRYGNQYNGQFSEGQLHGYGQEILIDGTTYTGDWVRGVKHGFGALTYTNGRSYYGEFAHGNPSGLSIMTEKNGLQKQIGELVGEKFLGPSINQSIPQAQIRLGEYRENIIHGLIAEKTRDEGLKIIGIHNGFNADGVVLKHNSDGTAYIGEVKHTKPHGMGILTKPDGLKLIGNFENGIWKAPNK